jgi:hypothetical protein
MLFQGSTKDLGHGFDIEIIRPSGQDRIWTSGGAEALSYKYGLFGNSLDRFYASKLAEE